MKTWVVLVVCISTLVALSETGPLGPASQNLITLGEVLRREGKDAALELPAAAQGTRAFGCYVPGCIFQCQLNGYSAGGICKFGTCYCIY